MSEYFTVNTATGFLHYESDSVEKYSVSKDNGTLQVIFTDGAIITFSATGWLWLIDNMAKGTS